AVGEHEVLVIAIGRHDLHDAGRKPMEGDRPRNDNADIDLDIDVHWLGLHLPEDPRDLGLLLGLDVDAAGRFRRRLRLIGGLVLLRLTRSSFLGSRLAGLLLLARSFLLGGALAALLLLTRGTFSSRLVGLGLLLAGCLILLLHLAGSGFLCIRLPGLLLL